MPTEPPRLVVVGCNHQRTPLEIRERMALGTAGVRRLQEQLKAQVHASEVAVLSTCNRLEIYAVTRSGAWKREVATALHRVNGFPVDEFMTHAYAHENLDSVRHAFLVAAGLDSQMVGETQILGQMKSAYAEATQDQSIGPVLHRFFQKSFQAAKWARTETKIGSGQVSLGNVAVELATRIFGRLTVSRTLVIGSGEVGREVAKALRSRGVACMSIASRTHERAERLAREVDGLLIPYRNWEETLPYVDIGVFATSAPGFLLDREAIARALERRLRRPLFLIDLAVPRDIDPAAAELPNLYLYNLEDLAKIANENLSNRQLEVEACRKALAERARHTWQHLRLES